MQHEISILGFTYTWTVFGGVLTVTAPDGRQKITQLGSSSPETLARMLARELAGEAPK